MNTEQVVPGDVWISEWITALPTRFRNIRILLTVTLGGIAAEPSHAFTWPWDAGPWPSSSDTPVQPLPRPGLLEDTGADGPLRFVVYGDQRAVADGEWQDLVARVAARHAKELFHFVIDTGDIVDDGRHTDQFARLTQILAPIRDLPYFVAVGNHEVYNNQGMEGRRHTARLMEFLDPSISPERLYYSVHIGSVHVLLLDTNDLTYGPVASEDAVVAQIRWLDQELAQTRPEETVIVAMHHPFLQSSKRYRKTAIALWNRQFDTHTLPERFLDAGVDLVLVGHTHTYERFRVQRDDRQFDLVNVSGRPRTSRLWIGDGAPRAEDIRGQESAWFSKHGWEGLDSLTIDQRAVIVEDEHNQYAIVTVAPNGTIDLEVSLVDGEEETIFERVELR